MSAATDRQSDYISTARQATRDLWNALNTLESLQNEWDALDYTNTLEEFAGANDGLTAADVSAVVFTATDAVRNLLVTGFYSTSLAKLL